MKLRGGMTTAVRDPAPALVEIPRVGITRVGFPQVDALARRRLLRGSVALLVVAFLTLVGLTGWQLHRDSGALQETRRQAAATAEDLARVDDQLEVTRAELVTAGEELAVVEGRLAVLEGDLATRTAEREALLAGLAATVDDLTAKTEFLGATKRQLAGQLAEVQALRSCLAGVSQALTLVTFDDDRRALDALGAVEDSCASAEASVALE
ncbi:MAG: hypothetical protein M3R01_07945 [Actinomycetota bacterium]|nr:hypothetical protein [Actinomycetota bacterium]